MWSPGKRTCSTGLGSSLSMFKHVPCFSKFCVSTAGIAGFGGLAHSNFALHLGLHADLESRSAETIVRPDLHQVGQEWTRRTEFQNWSATGPIWQTFT
jgi:hypothetical protein